MTAPKISPSNWLMGEWLDCLKNTCQCTWSRQSVPLPPLGKQTARMIVVVRQGQAGAGVRICVRADRPDGDFLEHEYTLSMCVELGVDPRKLGHKF